MMSEERCWANLLNDKHRREKGQEHFLSEQRFDEGVWVEFSDVFGFFAEADEFNGDVELVFNSDDDSTACCAVKFG